jgi:hypothetical protein
MQLPYLNSILVLSNNVNLFFYFMNLSTILASFTIRVFPLIGVDQYLFILIFRSKATVVTVKTAAPADIPPTSMPSYLANALQF